MAIQTARSKSNVYWLGALIANGDTDTLLFHIPDGRDTVSVQVTGTTTSGTWSGTFQAYISNDGNNWLSFDTTLVATTLASGVSVGKVLASNSYRYLKFTLSGIAGTGAQLTLSVAL